MTIRGGVEGNTRRNKPRRLGRVFIIFLLLFIYLFIRRAHVGGPKANGRRARSISATQTLAIVWYT